MTEQLEALPPLLRFQYEDTSRLLCRLFEPLAARYSEAAAGTVLGGAAGAAELSVVEGQLTWLVYVIGAVIRGRLSSAAADSQESLDGELAVRAFQLVRVMDLGPLLAARAGEQSRQRLELAVLAFFQNFRKVYVGEQAMHSSKVYVQMAEHAGLHDHLAVLNACVAKARDAMRRSTRPRPPTPRPPTPLLDCAHLTACCSCTPLRAPPPLHATA